MADPPHPGVLSSSSCFSFLPTATQPIAFTRPLKRRYTESSTDFIPPSTTSTASAPTVPIMSSFNPRPYYPSASATRPSVHTRAHARNPGAVAHLPTLDPTPDDSDAVFIHPPFTDFPDAHKYKEGLTYSVLAVNLDWFLDPNDYQQLNGLNPEGTKYPPQLEPPRGWCPAKKKEAKEGWADGEEPRLRCTFCRRTYAGVNAKSMWRRHVFEKHKIAMSNRRENAERKGRGSNKENKEGPPRSGTSTARGAAKVETQPSTVASSSRSAYRLRPAAQFAAGWGHSTSERGGSVDDESDDDDDDDDDDSSAESQPPPVAQPDLAVPEELIKADLRASTPPLTPALSPSSSSSLSYSLDLAKAIPPSPYNPLQTPSFKHSPPRPPSDQPWRFPSPSHPLHSSAREMSLCMLAQAESSPMVRGLDVSPVLLVPKSERSKQSIFSSPISVADKPPRDFSLLSSITSKPTPRRLFSESMLPTPLTDRLKSSSLFGGSAQHRASPLAMGFTPIKSKIIPLLTSTPSTKASGGAWSTGSPAKNSDGKGFGLMGPIELSDDRIRDDPFAEDSYRPWPATPDSTEERALSPPESSPEMESPVIRASQLKVHPQSQGDSSRDSSLGNMSTASGNDSAGGPPTGMGLLEGFSLKARVATDGSDSDDEDVEMFFSKLTDEILRVAPLSSPMGPGDGSPVPAILAGRKTRRELFSPKGGDCSPGSAQPMKRRRTLSRLSD